MKKISILLIMMSVLLNTGCSTTENGITVGNMSQSDCLEGTRAFVQTPKLQLEREGTNINVSLTNYYINCGINSSYVDCQQNGNRLNLSVKNHVNEGNLMSNCVCPINIYCTLYDIEGNNFLVFLDGEELGTVSFNDHRIVLLFSAMG